METKEVLNQALGVDISKDSFSSCLGISKVDLSKDFKSNIDLSNDEQGFLKLVKWIEKARVKEKDLVVVMEATGVYHEGLAHYLYDKGYTVCIMQSGRVKRYAQSLDQRSKTDALDSKMLSMLGCERKLTAWSPPSSTMEALRYLSRERSAIIKERSIEKNRNHAITIGVYTHKKSLSRYSKRMKLLNSQVEEIENDMAKLVSKDSQLAEKLGYLKSIPGVSFITAITVIAETFGFSLIENSKQLVSYCGYDVVLKESGTYKGQTRISKKGNKHIRAVLHMPSMTAIRLNPTLKPFYERLKPKKIKPIVALVAVQRKMLVLMYSLWKNNQYYDAKYEQKKAAKNCSFAAQDNFKVEFEIS
jgi:transposase